MFAFSFVGRGFYGVVYGGVGGGVDSGMGRLGMVSGGGVVGGGFGFADSRDARDVGGGVSLWGDDWGIGECDGIVFGGDGGVWVVSRGGARDGGLVDWGERVE